MKPTDENVGLHSAREFEVAQGDVHDVLVQMGAAVAVNLGRHFVKETQHYRDVMGSEAPENVFLGPDFPYVQAVRVQVVDLTQYAVLDQLLQLHDCRMVAKDVSHHQDPSLLLRHFHELLAMPDIDCQRLLDEDI